MKLNTLLVCYQRVMTMKVEGKIEVAACAQQTITWKNWENVAIYCYETFSDDI